ncbi:hypothetical protein VPNG_08672 [Cytospora leucostoma]|uniref:Clr5 domain-containing protein n=1 Tax=Cytospora leucostoma TaxID=1230097 RepID=A0A423W3D8_9PEZI|nr:hypothetical protein VPNG_08672 [Cytospora leucostoma]
MSLSKSLAPVTAETAKDLRIWDEHRDVLHHLYILDDKTLKQVKEIMESAYQFPETKECTYEFMLRERLGLRKNLSKKEWVALGRHIAKRRQRHKNSEVFFEEGPLGPSGGPQKTLLETVKVHDSDLNGSSTANGASEQAFKTPQGFMS